MSHPSEATLHDLVDDELAPDERAVVAAHLADCAECRAAVAALEALRSDARSSLDGEIAPAPAAWSAIAVRIGATERSFARPAWLRAAAMVALLAAGGFLWSALRRAPAEVAVVAPPAPDTLGVALAARSPGAQIEGAYAPDLAALERTIAAHRDRLAPETLATIEANLAVLDRAIAEINAALESDPLNRGTLDALDGSYRAKLDLLRRAALAAPAA